MITLLASAFLCAGVTALVAMAINGYSDKMIFHPLGAAYAGFAADFLLSFFI